MKQSILLFLLELLHLLGHLLLIEVVHGLANLVILFHLVEILLACLVWGLFKIWLSILVVLQILDVGTLVHVALINLLMVTLQLAIAQICPIQIWIGSKEMLLLASLLLLG